MTFLVNKKRLLMVLGMVIAGLCLVRVLTVSAAEEVEVYSAYENGKKFDDDANSEPDEDELARREVEEQKRAEIRITPPDEAATRVADQSYDMVPGVARLQAVEPAIEVPLKKGRAIASEPSGVTAAAPEVSMGNREIPNADAPVAFSSRDARARALQIRNENIVVTNQAPTSKVAYGLQSEPIDSVRIQPPLASSAMRPGTQEVSVIVSDTGFIPARIFVTQNLPVKLYLTTTSKMTSCFMLDNFGVKKGIAPGRVEEVTFVPDEQGDYRFYCPVKTIEGQLTVRPAPTAGQATRGVASEIDPRIGRRNEPKNSAQLRALIED